MRTADTLTGDHPNVTFLPLSVVLRRWGDAGVDAGPFQYGLAILRPRYAALGLPRLLPLDRVLYGIQSTAPGAFGGFHHPNQGYRHLQMRPLITTYGPMGTGFPEPSELVALDLLRAYAHDCLHYGSYRSYRLRGDEVVRTQYGVNFRRHDGRTYSAPDLAGSPTTRNLGVVMEGACDREARRITREAARQHGVQQWAGIDRSAYRDVTGLLDRADVEALAQPEICDAVSPSPAAAAFLGSNGRYQASVNARYATFLDEIGRDEADDLHDVVLTAMISGQLSALSAWLRERRGPKAFESLFLSPVYFGPIGPAT
ncbi:hypothetical protein ACFZB5_14325 [Streptomyces nodosus]|uniref:hypothetical protein n=1 Tax=Streptomyces nodosus TaxID=40318 RepID=UPI0036DFF1F9